MLISSPEVIANYISKIPVGTTITPKEMRNALAKEKGADNNPTPKHIIEEKKRTTKTTTTTTKARKQQ